jgi:acetate kinase
MEEMPMLTNSSIDGKFVLAMNVGSSSIKYAVFPLVSAPNGKLGAVLRGDIHRRVGAVSDDTSGLDRVLTEIELTIRLDAIVAVGHRIVHGGAKLAAPQIINADLIAQLKQLVPFAPEHLPAEIALIEQILVRFPQLPQIACFDTAFHKNLPRVAQLLPIPRRYEQAGIRRYGFHGLSYKFLHEELTRLGDPAITSGAVILAHLGNGASLAAVRDGQCIDTSMAFTPAAGLVMATRAGDIDPGLIAYISEREAMTPERLAAFVTHECGLLGVSETSGDMRRLMAIEQSDPRAAEAIALFCYQVKKWIGAFTAALGGLDTLVFSGGIGEHNAIIRARICAGLDYLGVDIDDAQNALHAALISSARARVKVRVIPTDEESVIARAMCHLLQSQAA